MEYTIVGETDYESGNRIEEKAVSVEITGYDIGGYYKKYLDNRAHEGFSIMGETYSSVEMIKMRNEDPNGFTQTVIAADLEYFKTVMEECKEAGKTYECKDAQFIAFYSTAEKEWPISTNSNLASYVDYVTNGLNSVLLEY
jgi:hypothetical protein